MLARLLELNEIYILQFFNLQCEQFMYDYIFLYII
jgi:hypothetical protein